jgi:hypothetical protein
VLNRKKLVRTPEWRFPTRRRIEGAVVLRRNPATKSGNVRPSPGKEFCIQHTGPRARVRPCPLVKKRVPHPRSPIHSATAEKRFPTPSTLLPGSIDTKGLESCRG